MRVNTSIVSTGGPVFARDSAGCSLLLNLYVRQARKPPQIRRKFGFPNIYKPAENWLVFNVFGVSPHVVLGELHAKLGVQHVDVRGELGEKPHGSRSTVAESVLNREGLLVYCSSDSS